MIQVRRATKSDLEGILKIYNDVINTTTAVYEYRPHTLAMRRTWLESKEKDGYPVFVAVDEEGIAGYSYFGPFRAWPAYKYSIENSVFVASERRGQGIGKLLMPPIIEAAIQKEMHVMIASIEATNIASLRLHQHFGYVEVAHFKEVGYKFGRWLDLKFLQLTLNTPHYPNED